MWISLSGVIGRNRNHGAEIMMQSKLTEMGLKTGRAKAALSQR